MEFEDATPHEIDTALRDAEKAFTKYRKLKGSHKAVFLRSIAAGIDESKDLIVETASKETNLSLARIEVERKRTVGHLHMFANYIEEGSWVEARIDTAIPDRTPTPKPDLRKMMVPIGPVVVFGASNFPLAYSTAGGDTVSALAAGCPVIVKAHPAHPQTSNLIAQIILKSAKATSMPDGVFQHVYGAGIDVGQALVLHPLTKAVGFTGSFVGGKALFDLANKREEPIPVFSEMGSINPVFILPQALKKRKEEIANMYANSITQSVGQFCTNPGLLLGVKNGDLVDFYTSLGEQLNKIEPATMLHPGIASNFIKKRETSLQQAGVTRVTEQHTNSENGEGDPTLATVNAKDFIPNAILMEEVFGPYSLLVQGESLTELEQVLDKIPGQLTATIFGEENELLENSDFIDRVREKAGRLIINGVPTGVEVCPSMNHGGPFPATTDSRFTSVGTDAIKRFVRPVTFQNFPDALLPDELKESNPLSIWRLRNDDWKK